MAKAKFPIPITPIKDLPGMTDREILIQVVTNQNWVMTILGNHLAHCGKREAILIKTLVGIVGTVMAGVVVLLFTHVLKGG